MFENLKPLFVGHDVSWGRIRASSPLAGSVLKEEKYLFPGCFSHSFYRLQLLESGLFYPGNAPEMAQQNFFPDAPDTRDIVELGMHRLPVAQLSVVGYGKPMRLVSNAGYQVGRGTSWIQEERLFDAGKKDAFELTVSAFFSRTRLCKPDDIRFLTAPAFFRHTARSCT